MVIQKDSELQKEIEDAYLYLMPADDEVLDDDKSASISREVEIGVGKEILYSLASNIPNMSGLFSLNDGECDSNKGFGRQDIEDLYFQTSGIKYLGYRPTTRRINSRPEITEAQLLYLTFCDDGCLQAKVNIWPINNSSIIQGNIISDYKKYDEYMKDNYSEEIKKLITDSRSGKNVTYNNHNPCGGLLQWRKPCYFFIVMDQDCWEVAKRTEANGDIISDCLHIATHKRGQARNLTFFNGGFFNIEIDGKTRTVVYCENHHMSYDGTAQRAINTDVDVDYKLDLIYRVTIKTDHGDKQETVFIDPTGTNFGPP